MLAETTINIPMWIISATIISIICLTVIYKMNKAIETAKGRRTERKLLAEIRGKEKLVEQEKQRRLENERIFPEPWLSAYETCLTFNDSDIRRAWLNKWMKNNKLSSTLSPQALEKFAGLISTPADAQWHKNVDILGQYLEMPKNPEIDIKIIKELDCGTTEPLKEIHINNEEVAEGERTIHRKTYYFTLKECLGIFRSQGRDAAIRTIQDKIVEAPPTQQCHYDPNNKDTREGCGCEQCHNIQIAAMKECLRHIDSVQDRSRIEGLIASTKKLPYVNEPPADTNNELYQTKRIVFNDRKTEPKPKKSVDSSGFSTGYTKIIKQLETRSAVAELRLQVAAGDLLKIENENNDLKTKLALEKYPLHIHDEKTELLKAKLTEAEDLNKEYAHYIKALRIQIQNSNSAKNCEKSMKQRYDEKEPEGCSCHISPPCGYCTSHSECPKCHDIILNDWMVEFEDELICEECNLAILGNPEIEHLKKELAQNDLRLQAVVTDLRKTENENNNLKSEIICLERDLKCWEEDDNNEELKNEIDTLKKEIRAHDKQRIYDETVQQNAQGFSQMQTQLADTNNELYQTQTQLADTNNELYQTKHCLQDSEDANSELESEIKQDKSEIERLEQELRAINEGQYQTQRRLQQAEDSNEDVKTENMVLERDLNVEINREKLSQKEIKRLKEQTQCSHEWEYHRPDASLSFPTKANYKKRYAPHKICNKCQLSIILKEGEYGYAIQRAGNLEGQRARPLADDLEGLEVIKKANAARVYANAVVDIKEDQDETGNHNWQYFGYFGQHIRTCLHCAKRQQRQGNENWAINNLSTCCPGPVKDRKESNQLQHRWVYEGTESHQASKRTCIRCMTIEEREPSQNWSASFCPVPPLNFACEHCGSTTYHALDCPNCKD